MTTLIKSEINSDACLDFLVKYGNNGLSESMMKYINMDIDDLHQKFTMWVKWKNKNKINFGGEKVEIDSPIGIYTKYEYEWNGVSGWAELFQYLYNYTRI
jgi:hypothetical protein